MTPRELGRIYLGRSVNIFDVTLNPNPNKEWVVNVKEMGDDEIFPDPVAHTGIYEATGDSFAEFTRKFAADVGLKGSRFGFSAAVKAAYSSAVTRSATTKYTRINNTIVGHSVTIGRDPDVFVRGWLTDKFKDALTRQPAKEMFKEYGTHVAMNVMIGGSACYRCYSAATKSLTDETFTASARAKFKSRGGSIDGSTTLTLQEIQLLTNVEGEMSLDVYGDTPGKRRISETLNPTLGEIGLKASRKRPPS